MNAVLKSTLSTGRRRLIDLMQRVNFGRIEGLQVVCGEPIFDDVKPRVVREVKFGAENGPRAESGITDFALKKEVIDLFAEFDRLRNARIETLTVKHGLPFGMHVEANV